MYLLDTNVLSEIVRPRPNEAVIAKIAARRADGLFASELTRYELRFGATRIDDAGTRWARIERDVVPLVKWLEITGPIAERGGDIAAALQRVGREAKSPVDPLLAATASVYRLTLVTRNVRDFAHIPGLNVSNWFE